MDKQQQKWIEHTNGLTVQDIINLYNNPSVFQTELAELINNIIKANNYKSSIELGCETGVTTMFLDDSIVKTFLDLNPDALRLAQEACLQLGIEGEFICGDMFNTSFPDNSFDIVFNAGVVEHFTYDERKRFLKEYKRILKPDGTMIIAYPNHYSTPYRSAYLVRNYLFMGYKWQYPKEFKLYDMSKELIANGLNLEKREILSKASIFNWWNFFKPIKAILVYLDRMINFEGYLTVLIIKK